MSQPRELYDSERAAFLCALRDSNQKVTIWEKDFIFKAIKYQSTAPAFSDRQRVVIDRMMQAYPLNQPTNKTNEQ